MAKFSNEFKTPSRCDVRAKQCSIFQKFLDDHVQDTRSISIPGDHDQNVPYMALTRGNQVMWHQLAKCCLFKVIQKPSLVLNDDHHHLDCGSSDSHQIVAMEYQGSHIFTHHTINISNANNHGINVLTFRNSSSCKSLYKSLYQPNYISQVLKISSSK